MYHSPEELARFVIGMFVLLIMFLIAVFLLGASIAVWRYALTGC